MKLRVVMIGAVRMSAAILAELDAASARADATIDLVGIVTREDDGYHADYCDLRDTEAAKGCPAFAVRKINDPVVVEKIRLLQPDVIFCCGWSQLLNAPLCSIPRLGVVGYHPSLLPEGRGRHPIIWALALGLDRTGSTFFKIDGGVDTGPIISQVRVPITDADNAGMLYHRLMSAARVQVRGMLPRLRRVLLDAPDSILGAPAPSVWRKRDMRDARVDWRMSARSICNLVRGLSAPYHGARCTYKAQDDITIYAATPTDRSAVGLVPGTVLYHDLEERRLIVTTGDGMVALTNYDINLAPSPDAIPRPGDYLR